MNNYDASQLSKANSAHNSTQNQPQQQVQYKLAITPKAIAWSIGISIAATLLFNFIF